MARDLFRSCSLLKCFILMMYKDLWNYYAICWWKSHLKNLADFFFFRLCHPEQVWSLDYKYHHESISRFCTYDGTTTLHGCYANSNSYVSRSPWFASGKNTKEIYSLIWHLCIVFRSCFLLLITIIKKKFWVFCQCNVFGSVQY